jgi:hypothetical protein
VYLHAYSGTKHSFEFTVEPAYKDMLWISNLTGIIEAFTGKPIFEITFLRIALPQE